MESQFTCYSIHQRMHTNTQTPWRRHTMSMWRWCRRLVAFLVALALDCSRRQGTSARAHSTFDLFCHRFICRLPPLRRRRRRRHRCLSPSCIELCNNALHSYAFSSQWQHKLMTDADGTSIRGCIFTCRVRMLFVRCLRQIFVWSTTLLAPNNEREKLQIVYRINHLNVIQFSLGRLWDRTCDRFS